MSSTIRLAVLGVLAASVAACQASGSMATPAGPTAAAAGVASNVKASESAEASPWLEGRWGALAPLGVHHSAATESGFDCTLGPFGLATNSHAAISDSGNETVTCSGSFPDDPRLPPSAVVQKDQVACDLHFTDNDGDGAGDKSSDSQLVITPSGQVSLTCQYKK